MAALQKLSVLALLVTLLTCSTSKATEIDVTYEKDNAPNCPRNCKCENTEIRCNQALIEGTYRLSKSVERITFEQAIPCEESDLDRLMELVISNQIELAGQCSKPTDLAGRGLAEVIDGQLQRFDVVKSERRRRSTFNQPSVYNFTVTPLASVSCSFDYGMCGWVQVKNLDFFDWTRNREYTPSSGTGPGNDYTQGNYNGYYLYIETSAPQVKGQFADIMSPPILVPTNDSVARVSFYYHAYGTTLGSLQVYAVYPRYSKSLYPVAEVTLISHNAWRPFVKSFIPLYNTYRIIIRGVVGSSYQGDIAIDNVFIKSSSLTCYSPNSESFGGLITKTASGYTCQGWGDQYPHHHTYTPSNYPNSALYGGECRNPGLSRDRPWCYTTSTNKTWEYCNVPVCKPQYIPTPEYPLGDENPIALVSLYNQPRNIGRLAIYHDGEWGTICNRGITNLDIGFLCDKAGFGSTGTLHVSNNYAGVGKVWLDGFDISCLTTENCTINNWGSTCTHHRDLWVDCDGQCATCINQTLPTVPAVPTTPNPNSQFILSIHNGYNSTTGWIQLTKGNEAGTICYSRWHLKAADVACRQMGYVGAFTSRPYGIRNPPSGLKTIISQIICKGYESIIDDCFYYEGGPTCSSYNVATISCYKEQPPVPSETLNSNSYCSFSYGLCTWKNTGNSSWVWHSNNGFHYNPFPEARYNNFIYLYKAGPSTIIQKAVLVSPAIFGRAYHTQYVLYEYRYEGRAFDSLHITYGTVQGDFAIYSLFSMSPTNNWETRVTPTFYPRSSFNIKLTCWFKATPYYNYRSIIAIRRIGVLYGNPPSSYFINVPGIAIGCSVGGVVLIVLIAIVCTRAHRKRVANTAAAATHIAAETPAVAASTNVQSSTTKATTGTQEKIPLNTSSATPAASTSGSAAPANTAPANAATPNSGVNVAAPAAATPSAGALPPVVQSQTPGITYLTYGHPQVASGVNQQGYIIAQPGYTPGQMTYAVSYNATTAVPVQQAPSQPPGYQGIFPQQNAAVQPQQNTAIQSQQNAAVQPQQQNPTQ